MVYLLRNLTYIIYIYIYIFIYIFLRRINTPHQKPTCQNTRTNMPTTRDQHEMSKKACRQCWSVGPECIFLRIICGMLVPGMKKIIFQKSNRWQDQHSKNYLCRHVGPRSACWSCCVGMLVFCRRVGPGLLAC